MKDPKKLELPIFEPVKQIKSIAPISSRLILPPRHVSPFTGTSIPLIDTLTSGILIPVIFNVYAHVIYRDMTFNRLELTEHVIEVGEESLTNNSLMLDAFFMLHRYPDYVNDTIKKITIYLNDHPLTVYEFDNI